MARCRPGDDRPGGPVTHVSLRRTGHLAGVELLFGESSLLLAQKIAQQPQFVGRRRADQATAKEIGEALIAGTMNSNSVISHVGTQTGLLTLDELEARMKTADHTLLQTFKL